MEELVEDHVKELSAEELTELQPEQHRTLTEEQSSEEAETEIRSVVLKADLEQWNEFHDFFEEKTR